MAPRRRAAATGAVRRGGSALTIIGYGTTSCVVRRDDGAVVKIVTDPKDVERPEVLAALRAMDPAEAFFAVPRSVTVRPLTAAERETLERCVATTPIKGSKVTSDVAEATFVEMVDAGPTLKALAEGPEAGSWPVQRVIETAVKILTALGKIHESGWVHRDLHIHNVAIAADGTARLLDFGNMVPFETVGVQGIEADAKGYVAILSKLLTMANPNDDAAKFACLRNLYTTVRRGIGRLPRMDELSECSAATGEAPVSPAPSRFSPLRSGKRLFGVSPKGSPKTPTGSPPAKVQRTPAARGDDGAGPSATPRRKLF